MIHLRRRHRRKGLSIVFSVLCMVVLMSIAALAIDIGYLYNAQAELQRSADAAALAACWEMGEQYVYGSSDVTPPVRTVAISTAASNDVTSKNPNLAASDIEIGYLSDFNDRQLPLLTADPTDFNAVKVQVRRDNSINGRVGTFLARAIGINGINAAASATAVILNDINGFEMPNDGSNLNILPFALDVQTWEMLVAGTGTDNYSFNPSNNQVTGGADSRLECNLFPQGTGPTGNRGTVDIGNSNNSTTDIERQILHGIRASDLSPFGGKLEFDHTGELALNGDTGISAAVQDELSSIVGQTRIIPIFSQVQGPGNNASYTIIRWCGVRIMDVKLTGPQLQKRLIVQPAPVASPGILPSANGSGTSKYVYSRAFLVR